MGVFCYFDGFPDDAGMVDGDIGYDFCFIEIDAVSCHVSAECLSTADRLFSSLVVENMFDIMSYWMLVLKAGSCDIAEELVPDDVLTDLEEKLQEVIESTLENYDFDYQIEESQKILTHKLDELSGKINLLEDTSHHYVYTDNHVWI